jgi:hypothetical protein
MVLFINGRKSGVYIVIERVTEAFYASQGIPVDRIYESKLLRSAFAPNMISDPGSGLEMVHGEFHAGEISRLALWANSPPSPEMRALIEGTVDVENMIRFFATTLFLANCDGYHNNLRLAFDRDLGLLRFSPWDWERVFDSSCTVRQLLSFNHLALKILEYPDLRRRFLAVLRGLDESFPPERVDAAIDARFAQVSEAIRQDPYLGPTSGASPERIDRMKRSHLEWRNELRELRDETIRVD